VKRYWTPAELAEHWTLLPSERTLVDGRAPVPSGSVLVGFQGRAGDSLNQLQPLLCTFSPAIWK
jgi:hypothetical protein